jgi:3-oxoacyl-[acyl-carrier-protein] synthase II
MNAMLRAMKAANVDPSQVGYINAHGTSTPIGDPAETLAIKRAFGDHAYKLAVSSSKSMTGHTLGAAGAIESMLCVLALKHQKVTPTINLDNADPDCDLDYVPNVMRELPLEYTLNNSFGFGGHNVSLVFKRY